MKKLVVISLVGCLLGANQLFGDLKEFNALAKKGGRANSQRLLEIYATLTSPQEKVSAQSTLRRLGIDFSKAVAPATRVVPAPVAAAPVAVAAVPSQDQINLLVTQAQEYIKTLASDDLTQDDIDDATGFAARNRNILPADVLATINAAIASAQKKLAPVSKLRAEAKTFVPAAQNEFVALNTEFLSGRMSTATMEKALKEFRSKFPTSTDQIKTLEDVLKKTMEAQAEMKVSKEEASQVAAFLALDTYAALNKKIEDATVAGTKLSQAQIQEVTNHINNLASLSAAEKTTLITSLDPLL